MILTLVRILFALLFICPTLSIAQIQEDKIINNRIDSLLKRAVLAVEDLKYDQAIHILTQSRELAERIDHKKRIALTTGTLSKLHFQLKDYHNAQIENTKAISLQIESDNPELLAQSYITQAKLDLLKNTPKNAIKHIDLGLSTLSNTKRPDLKAELYCLKADLLRSENKNYEAILVYEQAIQEATIGNDDLIKTQAQVNKAISLSSEQRIDEAKQTIEKVETFLKKQNYPDIENTILLAKSNISHSQNKFKEANEYLVKYYNYKNSDKRYNSIVSKHKNESIEKISTSLKNDIAKETNSFPEVSQFIIVITILLFIILIILVLLLYKNNNVRAKANDLLQEKNVELIIARDNAEKASNVKAQFLSTITHELRTPMYAVTGLTHLLLSENPTEEQKKHLDSLKFSGEYLLSLINNILDLNKLEANKVEVEKTEFNIKKRIDDVLFTLNKSAKDKGNKLNFEFDQEIPHHLMGDPLMISQILINLVGNAIKFTRDGEVTVRVGKLEQDDKNIDLHFEIEDNGEGISKKKQKTIFQSFTQGSVAINRKFGGTGLGLSIVKNLLDLLNSKISLESTLGKGTIFKFDIKYDLIPKSIDEEDEKNLIQKIDYKALENRHILIVEDNKINQMITRKILEKNNITCETADNGEIAVERVRKEKYDLILMDIHMPGISGMEATQHIRTFDQEIPILALTAVTIEENLDEFYQVGFNDVIPKPYKIEEFFLKIYNGLKNANVID